MILARIAIRGGSGVARISTSTLSPRSVDTPMPNPNTITLPTL
jgi:hypothetical protein